MAPSSIPIVALQALLVADFGPRTSLKIIDAIRKDILAGGIKSGEEIKVHDSLFLVCHKANTLILAGATSSCLDGSRQRTCLSIICCRVADILGKVLLKVLDAGSMHQ